MKKILSLALVVLSLIFFYKVFEYYSSESNSDIIKKNRGNIDKLVQENTSNLPVLDNDTNNVIEFNSGYNMDNKKKRSFWNLLNKK